MSGRNGNQQKATKSKPDAIRRLTVRQQRALAELLRGETITAAAKTVGVRRETIHGWLQQPLFREEYRDGCERLKAELENRLTAMAGKAADVLATALAAGDTKIALEVFRLAHREKSQVDLSVEHRHSDDELDELAAGIIADLRAKKSKRSGRTNGTHTKGFEQ